MVVSVESFGLSQFCQFLDVSPLIGQSFWPDVWWVVSALSIYWWSLRLMTIIESLERFLLSLSPYIKCPIKMCVNVFQRDMFLTLLILDS